MKKEDKATAIAELHEKFSRAKLAVMTECSGMEVNHITELRRQLRGIKAEFKVVKNTLAARAVEGTQLAPAKPHFKGPLAVMIGYDDPAVATKILRDFIKAEIAATGPNYFVPWLAFGDMTLKESLHSVELLSREVMPAFA